MPEGNRTNMTPADKGGDSGAFREDNSRVSRSRPDNRAAFTGGGPGHRGE